MASTLRNFCRFSLFALFLFYAMSQSALADSWTARIQHWQPREINPLPPVETVEVERSEIFLNREWRLGIRRQWFIARQVAFQNSDARALRLQGNCSIINLSSDSTIDGVDTVLANISYS